MEPNALLRADAPKLSQKSSTPRMMFENAASVPVNVYWMTVNKRHLQAALSRGGKSRCCLLLLCLKQLRSIWVVPQIQLSVALGQTLPVFVAGAVNPV